MEKSILQQKRKELEKEKRDLAKFKSTTEEEFGKIESDLLKMKTEIEESKKTTPVIEETVVEETGADEENKEVRELKNKVENRTEQIDKMMQEMDNQEKEGGEYLSTEKIYLEQNKGEEKNNTIDNNQKEYKNYSSYRKEKDKERREQLKGPVDKLVDGIFQYAKEKEKPQEDTQTEVKENNEEKEYLNRIENAIREGKSEEEIQKIEKEFYEKFVKTKEKITDTSKESTEKTKNMEEILERLVKKEEEAKIKLEASPFKNKILKATQWWENLGVEQKDEKGEVTIEGSLKKRMLKMTISLALIGAISMGSVDVLAKTGLGTATAIGGTALVKRMAMGLGMGALMDVGGSKIPPKIKKWIPLAVGALGAGAAFALTGGVAGGLALASVGVGYASTKFMSRYSDEKIKQRQNLEKEKMLRTFKGENGTIDPKHFEKIEGEYAKILKKYERQRVWNKPIVEISKILAGSVISAGMLEVSGAMQDQQIHSAELKAHLDAEKTQHEAITKQLEEMQEKHLQHEAEMKNINESQHMQEILVHKGEGIEHSFIRQIEHNPTLAKELGYEGDLNDTKALHEFAGREAHVIAIKEGYVDNAGHEVRILEADKVGYEIKTENGHIIVEEKTASGEIIETHHEGDKFEDNLEKGEYIKKPNEIENNSGIPEQKPIDITGASNEVSSGETTDITGSANDLLDQKPIDVTGLAQETNEKVIEGQSESGDFNISREGASPNTPPIDQVEIHPTIDSLSPEARHVYDENIEKMFPNEKSMSAWNYIKNSTTLHPAKQFIDWEGPIAKPYESLLYQMQTLHNVTDLEPISNTEVFPPTLETPEQYIIRAMQKATLDNKLDEVKFHNIDHSTSNAIVEEKFEKPSELPKTKNTLETTIEGNTTELKHFEFGNNDHTISVNENGASLKMHFNYDENGNVSGTSVEGSVRGTNPYMDNSKFEKLPLSMQPMAKEQLLTLRTSAEFLDKLPKGTQESEYLHKYVNFLEKTITDKYGKIINYQELHNADLPKVQVPDINTKIDTGYAQPASTPNALDSDVEYKKP